MWYVFLFYLLFLFYPLMLQTGDAVSLKRLIKYDAYLWYDY